MRTAMTVAGAFVLAMVPALSAAGQTTIEALPPAPTVEPLYPMDAVPVRQMPLRQAESDRPVRMAMVEQALPTPAMFEVPALVSPPVPSYRKPAPVPVVAAPVPHFVAPEVALEQAVGEAVVLPANSMIVLHVDGGLSSSDGSRAGDTVKLTVARDVRFGGRVVIPRGTPAYGEISRRTGQGMFGKSGKVDITVTRVDLRGQIIPIAGAFKEKGQGKAGKTILFGLLTGLQGASQVRGEDAEFSADRDLEAATTTAVTIR
jgi:hypothetical protein